MCWPTWKLRLRTVSLRSDAICMIAGVERRMCHSNVTGYHGEESTVTKVGNDVPSTITEKRTSVVDMVAMMDLAVILEVIRDWMVELYGLLSINGCWILSFVRLSGSSNVLLRNAWCLVGSMFVSVFWKSTFFVTRLFWLEFVRLYRHIFSW